MRISGVMAVHNEALYLRYSLPALEQIPFNELIFVLDRCTDNSEEIIRKLAPHNSKIIFKKEQHWVYTRAGEAFQTGFDKARNDLVFALGADLILTPRAFAMTEDKMQDPKVGSVFFGLTQRSIAGVSRRVHTEYLNIVKRLFTDHISPYATAFSTGVYCFRKSLVKLRDVPAEYDDLHNQIRAKGYEVVYVPDAGIIHLRTGLSKERQIWHGKVRAKRHEPLTKVALHSIINFKPWTLIAFLSCRE